jgi:hypothetical protein
MNSRQRASEGRKAFALKLGLTPVVNSPLDFIHIMNDLKSDPLVIHSIKPLPPEMSIVISRSKKVKRR